MVDIARMVCRFGPACVARDTKVGISLLFRVQKIAGTHSAVQSNGERSAFLNIARVVGWFGAGCVHRDTKVVVAY